MSESRAAALLRGEPYPSPPQEARDLVQLYLHTGTDYSSWYAAIAEADVHALVAAIGGIDPARVPAQYGNRTTAYREAARSMVEQKLAEQMVAKMDALERASNRLAWVGIAVAAAGVLVAFL